MNAAEVAARLRQDDDPVVAGHIAWAERRGRFEELRLLQPFEAAGFVERVGEDLRLTPAGMDLVREMQRTGPVEDYSRSAKHRHDRALVAA